MFKMNSLKFIILSVMIVGLGACSKNKDTSVDLAGIQVDTDITRFEQQFYTSSSEDLGSLKTSFTYLFPANEPDSVWTAKMNDEDELYLYEASQKEFGDFTEQEEKLTSLFKHVKYYFPKFVEPKVITILSNIDFNNKVIYADSLLFISLDTYLGAEHEAYGDYPKYVKQNFTSKQLIVDVAGEIAKPILRRADSKSYVSNMIQQGKRLKLIESFLPEADKAAIIGYTPDQYQWAQANEESIWKYFINKEMLYSNDPSLTERFITDAPFSKFYLEVDQSSPGRIGIWFGWQIINSFMENNDVSLQEMLILENEEIFKASKYKPRKK